MREQVIVLALADQEALGHVRAIPGLHVARRADQVWLRGILDEEEVDLRIRQLPAIHRYVLSADDQLFLPQGRTPVSYLPRMEWQTILQYLPLELPLAAYAGQSDAKLPVCLVASGKEENAVALRCKVDHLKAWAESAAEVRIQCLRMVADLDGNAWVMGHPLPAIPGISHWSCEGLLLPAGHQLEFPLLAPLIVSQNNPEKDALVVLQADGSWERIPLALFVVATRSGIRLSPLTEP